MQNVLNQIGRFFAGQIYIQINETECRSLMFRYIDDFSRYVFGETETNAPVIFTHAEDIFLPLVVYRLNRQNGEIDILTEIDALNQIAITSPEDRQQYAETLRDDACGYADIIVRDIKGVECWFSSDRDMLIQQQNCNKRNVDCSHNETLPDLGENNDSHFVCANHRPTPITISDL